MDPLSRSKSEGGGRLTSFPWPSFLALLYPIYEWSQIVQTPAANARIAADTVGSMGYMFVFAGIVAGTFRIFRLSKRWHVLTMGALCFVIATLFSSFG
jgi:hypothetical protein